MKDSMPKIITLLDLGGPTDWGMPENLNGYVAIDLHMSNQDEDESGTFLRGNLEKGLPQIKDDSVQGTILLSSTLCYIDNTSFLAQEIARVSKVGTKVEVIDSIYDVDAQKQPIFRDDEFYNTLNTNGFQFTSCEILEEGKDCAPTTRIVFRKEDCFIT